MNSFHFSKVGKLYSNFKFVKRNYSDEPPKLLKKLLYTETFVNPTHVHDVYGHQHPAISKLSVNKTIVNCYDSVSEGPIRLRVRQPQKREVKALQAQEQYCMPCQIPCQLSHKYPIHKPDVSIRYPTENLRPTCLEVMVPAANPSEYEKVTRLPPTVMRDYPAPRNDDKDKYIKQDLQIVMHPYQHERR